MRTIINIFSIYFIVCSFLFSQSKIAIDSLFEKDGLILELSSNIPFTGIGYKISNVTGKKLHESTYLKGELHGTHTEWWDNENKKHYGRYKRGKKIGRWVSYYQNGKIKDEKNFKNGLNNGFHINYHDNGFKESRGTYKNGKKIDDWKYWDENGDIIEYICIDTEFGQITIILYPNVAPMHVMNFKGHIRSGLYNGTIFHRVIPGFIVQGGDPNSRSTNRKIHGIGGYASEYFGVGEKINQSTWRLPPEYSSISHKRGIISMARGYEENSAGSQFFICVKDSPDLDKRYTVFGEVVQGMEAIDKIAELPVDVRDNPIGRFPISITFCN